MKRKRERAELDWGNWGNESTEHDTLSHEYGVREGSWATTCAFSHPQMIISFLIDLNAHSLSFH